MVAAFGVNPLSRTGLLLYLKIMTKVAKNGIDMEFDLVTANMHSNSGVATFNTLGQVRFTF